MPNTSSSPFVSVVIPTIGRAAVLEQTVDYLLQQSYQNYEIIIIDQSERSETGKYENKSGIIKYVHIKERSVTNARNVGIKKSKGDIILFLDDDIIPDNDLIFHHVKGHKDKNIGCVAGSVIEDPDIITNSNIAGCTITISGRGLMNFKSKNRQYIYAATGGNMSLSKEAIKKTGFFDLRFRGSHQLEETDYCYRLRKKGYSILYEPEALVEHLRIKTGGNRLSEPYQLIYYRLHNTVLFYAKNMNRLFLPLVFAAHVFVAIKKVLIPEKNLRNFIKTVRGLFDGYRSYRRGSSQSF